jgi:adenine C2-methylase RlmN of 23S rRNA A2503 and tRNA A37
MLNGVNDQLEQAHQLGELLTPRRDHVHVNLVRAPPSPTDGTPTHGRRLSRLWLARVFADPVESHAGQGRR